MHLPPPLQPLQGLILNLPLVGEEVGSLLRFLLSRGESGVCRLLGLLPHWGDE